MQEWPETICFDTDYVVVHSNKFVLKKKKNGLWIIINIARVYDPELNSI